MVVVVDVVVVVLVVVLTMSIVDSNLINFFLSLRIAK